MEIKSRLDISQLFWEVDEFCESFETHCSQHLQLGSGEPPVAYRSRLGISEVTTIVIGFQGSGYRTFKDFYTLQVLPHWRSAFPNLVSYTRFVELMPWSMMVLCCFLQTRRGEVTGISFVDSTPIEVCHPCRSTSHRVFKG
ncbi:MAG: transposase, partial [Cyanobacteria bacterium P01_E01_bin.45]